MGVAAGFVAVLIVASGCGSSSSGRNSHGPGPANNQVPVTVPASFESQLVWSRAAATGQAPQTLGNGDAVIVAPAGQNWNLLCIDDHSGRTLWTSQPFAAAINSTGVPQVAVASVYDGGRSWVVTTAVSGKATTLNVYDPLAAADVGAPTQTVTFTGIAAAPTVTATTQGVLITNGAAQAVFHPASGQQVTLTAYRGSGGAATFSEPSNASAQPGRAVAAYDNGVIVAYTAGGFGYQAGGGGWTSAQPPGTTGAGTLLGANYGLVLSTWTSDNGNGLLVIEDVLTGTIIDSQPYVPTSTGAVPGDSRLIVSNDDQWGAYGPYLFNLRSHTTGKQLPIDNVTFSINEGVAYGVADSGEGASYATDIMTGLPVGGRFDNAPRAFDMAGHGLFLTGGATPVVFAAPVRPPVQTAPAARNGG